MKDTDRSRGGRSLLANILSLVALAVSLATAYFTSLSGPDIRVFVSSPQWVMRPVKIGEFPNKKAESQLGLKVTCGFSNHGARNGVIEDILLRLESQDGTRWLFYPGVQLDDAKFLEAGPANPPEAIKGVIGTFYPVSVVGKQSQVATYLFMPMLRHPNFPFGDLTPHRFNVSVLTRSNDDREWKTQQTFTVVLNQSAIEDIRNGTTMQLFPEELDSARREVR